ncbi:MAG: hypothetical protein ACOYN0_16490 [Phycisphaerales bacterium]
MDQRLPEGIREGAGREEARYNVEFIDFLQKWGTPMLLVACIAAGGYAAYNHFGRMRVEKLDAAFVEFEGAASGGSPESLMAVADQYEGVASVSMLARIEAAEAYRRSVMTGVKPGATVQQDGSVADPNDLMSDADRTDFLSRAEALYGQVLTESESDRNKAWFAVTAHYGMAAIEESRGEADRAKAHYESVIAVCEGTSLSAHAHLAKQRIEKLGDLAKLTKLPTRAEVPSLTPPAPPPAIVPAPAPEGPTLPAPTPDPAGPTPAPQTPAEQPAPEAPK